MQPLVALLVGTTRRPGGFRSFALGLNVPLQHRRRLRAKVEGKHTAAEVAEIILLQKGKCAYCRKLVGDKPHIDHIVPIAKGGTNDRRNLQLTCARCNQTKNRTDPIVFAQRLGLLI